MKLYICGPMSEHGALGIQAIDFAAKRLRSMGLEAVSPIELDGEGARAWYEGGNSGMPPGQTHAKTLERDLQAVAECDGLVLLDGWEGSKGCRIEVMAGLVYDKSFWYFSKGRLHEDNRSCVALGAVSEYV